VDSITGGARGAREGARALYQESEALRKSGDINGAMEKRLQMLRLRGTASSTLAALTGYAIQDMALYRLSSIASQLSAESSQKYAAELKELEAKIPTYAAMLEHEKVDEIKQVDSITRKPGEWEKLIKGFGFKPQQQAALEKMTPAQVKANIAKVYDSRIARAKRPYGVNEADPTVDAYTNYVTNDWGLARFLWTKNKTLRLFTIVALDRKTDHSLNRERVGPLPDDPFGSGPLKEKGGHVYSVGPDTIDDGGSSGTEAGQFKPSTKGDMQMPLFSPMRHLAQPID
jgi:hypothetical protein